MNSNRLISFGLINMNDQNPSDGHVSEIIALAWADEISFDEIKQKHGLSEKDVILLMRNSLKPRSFKLWRERVSGRKTKHRKLFQLKQLLSEEF
jgi:uncharacterized protein (TIGR03643 family)